MRQTRGRRWGTGSALVVAALLLTALGVTTTSTHGTRAGFTASVANTQDTVTTARYFQCSGAWTADRDAALFSWPLDDAPAQTTTRDTFTGTAGTFLQDRTSDTGSTWTKHGAGPVNAQLTDAGRLRKTGNSVFSLHRSDRAAPTPNYTVSVDVVVRSTVSADAVGVVGRMNVGSNTFTTGTYYTARYEQSGRRWALYSVVGGTQTLLGSSAATLSTGSTVRLSLDMIGNTIRLLVNGDARVVATDSSITEIGRPGIAIGTDGGTSYETTDTTGMQLDDFLVQPATQATDTSGHGAAGTYQGALSTGPRPTGAGCPRDPGGARRLDGTSTYVTYPTKQTNPQTFSMETWFRTSTPQGALFGFGDTATGPATTSDRLLYVADSGALFFGVRPQNVQTVRSPQAVTDGNWHHVAVTFSPRTGMTLYLDGSVVDADPTTSSAQRSDGYWRVGSTTIPSGWYNAPASPYFRGDLRYAAVYTTVLTDEQVRDHFRAGR